MGKGGIFKGPSHAQGGIPLVVKETGQRIETEGDEPLIAADALQNKKVKVRKGTNIQVLDKINKEAGAKGMTEVATEVHAGDAVVNKKSAADRTPRTFIGTDKQIVSAVNQTNGGRVIERGAKVIEPNGAVKQYEKGGDVAVINARWDKKKRQIQHIANNMQRLKLNVTKALNSDNEKEFLTALVISTMMKTGERVGNLNSEGNKHFGVTGFRKRHVKINGNKIEFKYTGKSGVGQEKIYEDKVLAAHLKKAIKNSPNHYVFCTSDGFRIKSDRINRFLSEFNLTSKDIRGYRVNKLITDKLEKQEIPDTEKERKKIFNAAAKDAAKKIGHGTATLKKHYMMPELADNYVFDSEIIDVKEAGYYASGGELGTEAAEKHITRRLDEKQRISVKELQEYMGRKLNWPWEYIGGLKLEKCFMLNYYKVV